jgi:acyl carrier protein
MMQLRSREEAEEVLKPKVRGTRVLEKVLQDSQLDFFVVCSALNALYGGFGQADYSAANAYLDAFAHYRAKTSDTFTVAINWDVWQEVGMAVNTKVPDELKTWAEENLRNRMLTHEALDAFGRIVSESLPQVVVSTRNLQAVIEQVKSADASRALESLRKINISQQARPRPNLWTEYVAPGTEVETCVAEIWQSLLGFKQIGIHDNFFELGGHSLLALQITYRLRESFQIEIPMGKLFEMPTIEQLALLIEDTLLMEIEKLSEDEVQRSIGPNP